jgi:hypothetical protein
MKLSEVPFNLLVTDKHWLTSANGKSGRIDKIAVHAKGKFFEVTLEIIWEDCMSFPTFPDECTNITVAEPTSEMCTPYLDAQIMQLDKHKEYFNLHRKPD